MRIVVADTGPLRYLAQTGLLELLPRLFEKVFLPTIVYDELCHPSTPEVVRAAITAKPLWIEIRVTDTIEDSGLSALDKGEIAAIALGRSISAELILMDDRKGVAAARAMGFEVTGTLGILDLAARRGMIEFAGALARLRTTNFRAPTALCERMLEEHIKLRSHRVD